MVYISPSLLPHVFSGGGGVHCSALSTPEAQAIKEHKDVDDDIAIDHNHDNGRTWTWTRQNLYTHALYMFFKTIGLGETCWHVLCFLLVKKTVRKAIR